MGKLSIMEIDPDSEKGVNILMETQLEEME
jgi:hypothetical protein